MDVVPYSLDICFQGWISIAGGCPFRFLPKLWDFFILSPGVIKNSFSWSLLKYCCISSSNWNWSICDDLGQNERPLESFFENKTFLVYSLFRTFLVGSTFSYDKWYVCPYILIQTCTHTNNAYIVLWENSNRTATCIYMYIYLSV